METFNVDFSFFLIFPSSNNGCFLFRHSAIEGTMNISDLANAKQESRRSSLLVYLVAYSVVRINSFGVGVSVRP